LVIHTKLDSSRHVPYSAEEKEGHSQMFCSTC